MGKRILYLPLKSKWYEMIESGEKKEEYREVKDYWIKRLIPSSIKFKRDENHDIVNYAETMSVFGFKQYSIVQFSYGYTKRTMQFEVDKIEINTGNPEWGAEEGKKYFVIKLGERVK